MRAASLVGAVAPLRYVARSSGFRAVAPFGPRLRAPLGRAARPPPLAAAHMPRSRRATAVARPLRR